MGKQFLTTLLVFLLVAPLAQLEAKGRHRHGNPHKFMGFPHSNKAEIKTINQAISDINTRIDALELQGDLPSNLAEKLDALQLAIDDNSSDIFSILGDITTILEDIKGISENGSRLDELKLTVADLSLKLAALTLTVDALDLRISALEQSTPPSVSEHVFSGDFFQGVAPVDDTQLAWNQFIGNATGEFTSIEISNSLGGSVICSDPLVSTNIANALNSFVTGAPLEEFNCGVNQEWSVGDEFGSGVTLHAGPTTAVSGCDDGATVRPLIGNDNWGGIGITCNAPTQILEVILTR